MQNLVTLIAMRTLKISRCMRSQNVLLQRELILENLSAQLTIHCSPIGMLPHYMRIQGILRFACCRAFFAFKGSFVGVCPHVVLKDVVRKKSFAADIARLWPVICVSMEMECQTALRCEAFTTEMAKVFGVIVIFHVFTQLGISGPLSATNVAFKRFCKQFLRTRRMFSLSMSSHSLPGCVKKPTNRTRVRRSIFFFWQVNLHVLLDTRVIIVRIATNIANKGSGSVYL